VPVTAFAIRTLGAAELEARAGDLADLLRDAVAHNASISFMPGLTAEGARAFWLGLAAEVAAGRRILLAAFETAWDGSPPKAGGRPGMLAGTVQLELIPWPNQPHRAEVHKLIVHTSARRRGIGRALMQAAEAEARERGRTLLTLDTAAGGPAEPLYRELGYVEAGRIPGFALEPSGALVATVVFYKRLG
jgi:ribosomal protein S18 acetylase RimI-like enzyme